MEFQFKPGDWVALEVDMRFYDRPKPYRVLERLTQECIGGVQRFYSLRCFTTDRQTKSISDATVRVHDFEVCAYPSDKEIEGKTTKMYTETAKYKATQKKIAKDAGLDPYELEN